MASSRVNDSPRVGPYVLGDRLGAGGMAEVYVATGIDGNVAGRRVAIKRILPQLTRDSRFVAMFCDEGRICSALRHPNIVQVVDFGEYEGELYMTMEYVDGISCAKLLRAVAARGRRIPVAIACHIGRNVLEALAFAHEARDEQMRHLRIVHRDVSPGNILISKRGEVKLGDFGIVRSEFIARRTYPGELKGKIGYMSPEQVVGAEVDARSDLFAAGIVLAELALTRPLFPGKNEMEVLTRIYEADLRVLDFHEKELPRELVEILRWTLKRRAQDRPHSARELADALDGFLTSEGQLIESDGLVEWLCSEELLPSMSGIREATPAPDGRRPLHASMRPSARMSDASALGPRSMVPTKGTSRTVYVVRLPSGHEVGPLGPLELIDGYATRRYPLDSVVLKNGARPEAARSLPELRGVVAADAFIDEIRQSRELVRVSLDRTRLPGFLYGVVQGQQTGVVLLEDGTRRLAISFRDGSPVGAVSSDRDFLLGTQLIRQGLIDESRLCEAMDLLVEGPSRAGLSVGRLGDVLIEKQWVAPDELERVLSAQLEGRVIGLCKWEVGEVAFFTGSRYVRGEAKLSTSPLCLLTKAVRQGFSGRELARILSSLGDNPIAKSPVARTRPEDLGLTAGELDALIRVAGTLSLGRFLAESVTTQGVNPDDVLRAVFIGMSTGLLVSPGWPWR